MAIRALTSPELALLRTAGQHSRLYLAGTETPPIVFAARINQSFTTHDMQAQITYDTVTTGAYTDILPGQTLWIGSAAGLYDVGEARIRKTPTSTILYIGRESELALTDNLYLTVIDEMRLWPRHVMIESGVIKMDQDVVYSDQHTNFDPVPIMGPDAVVYAGTYPVTVTFPEASESWVFDSTISAKLWTVTAGTLTNATTYSPTLTIASYPANGRIRVALKLTAANGKIFTGYRWVYVYDAAHLPVNVFQLNSCSGDHENGGFEFDVTMYGGAGQTTIRDRAPIILFAKDFYGPTEQSIGQAAGRENIVITGWIDGETIDQNPIAGTVHFTARGANYWIDKMSGYPPSVRLAKNTPALWTDMTALTVDRAVWHLLHWRSTATSVMDIRLTGDSRIAAEFPSSSLSLWQQIKEIATVRIIANPGVDPYGRFFLSVDPQLTPAANRTWAIIQDILKSDWLGKISLKREIVNKISMLSQSGIAVDASGSGTAFFSLANGHTFKHFGDALTMDGLLLSSQAQANELAGLQMAWKNNKFPQIDIPLVANNRMYTLFPNQFASITIGAADTLRGISYTGNLIPRSVSYDWNPETGMLSPTIAFEAEVFPDLAMNGDVPASTGIENFDTSVPPMPNFPPMPVLPFVEWPSSVNNPYHPKVVVFASNNYGVGYTTKFDSDSPTWTFMNVGLNPAVDFADIRQLIVTPSGALYLRMLTGGKVMRATRLGGTWVQIASNSDFIDINGKPTGIMAIGMNPLNDDQIAIASGGSFHAGDFTPSEYWKGCMRLSSGGVLGNKSAEFLAAGYGTGGVILYANGQWNLIATHNRNANMQLFQFNSSGAYLSMFDIGEYIGQSAMATFGRTVGTSAKMYCWDGSGSASGFVTISAGNLVTQYPVATYIKPNASNDMTLAISPTGQRLMATDEGGTNKKSSDGGTTWVAGIPYLYYYTIDNCRDENRWILAAGTGIYFTNDFATANTPNVTIFNKTGNLAYMTPLLDITHLRFIE
ncbi:MAG: hypothetical protein NTW69_06260 [Chloroflexi bacterium]|nr:hypothetical protein [Chloroflexota bacterium]